MRVLPDASGSLDVTWLEQAWEVGAHSTGWQQISRLQAQALLAVRWWDAGRGDVIRLLRGRERFCRDPLFVLEAVCWRVTRAMGRFTVRREHSMAATASRRAAGGKRERHAEPLAARDAIRHGMT